MYQNTFDGTKCQNFNKGHESHMLNKWTWLHTSQRLLSVFNFSCNKNWNVQYLFQSLSCIYRLQVYNAISEPSGFKNIHVFLLWSLLVNCDVCNTGPWNLKFSNLLLCSHQHFDRVHIFATYAKEYERGIETENVCSHCEFPCKHCHSWLCPLFITMVTIAVMHMQIKINRMHVRLVEVAEWPL